MIKTGISPPYWHKILRSQGAGHTVRQVTSSSPCPSKSLSCLIIHCTISLHSLQLLPGPHYHEVSQVSRESVNRKKAEENQSCSPHVCTRGQHSTLFSVLPVFYNFLSFLIHVGSTHRTLLPLHYAERRFVHVSTCLWESVASVSQKGLKL